MEYSGSVKLETCIMYPRGTALLKFADFETPFSGSSHKAIL